MAQDFVLIDHAPECGSDTVTERISGGQHDDGLETVFQDRWESVGQRRRPGQALTPDQRRGQSQVTRAANHQHGLAQQPARGGRQALDTVLANSQDGEPSRCGDGHRNPPSRAAKPDEP